MRWLLLLAACSPSKPNPAAAPPPPDHTGQATYYAADGTGKCSFPASPGDLMVAAINAAEYDHGRWCGTCLDVVGPMGEVLVRVVDECPGCKRGDLDLSEQAFAVLAPLPLGRIPITWTTAAPEFRSCRP